jgi:hypothetical protein
MTTLRLDIAVQRQKKSQMILATSSAQHRHNPLHQRLPLVHHWNATTNLIGPMATATAERIHVVAVLAEAEMDAWLQVGLAPPTSSKIGAVMVRRQLEVLHSEKE